MCWALPYEYREPAIDYTPAAQRDDYVGDEEEPAEGQSTYALNGNQTMTAMHYLYAWDGSAYAKVTSMSAGFNYGGSVNIPDRQFTIDTTNNAQGLMRDYVVFHANGNVMFFKGESLYVEFPSVSVYNGAFGALTSTSKIRNIEVQLVDTNDTVHRLQDVNVQYMFVGGDGPATSLHFIIDIPYLEWDVYRFSLLFDTSLDDFSAYSTSRYIGTSGVIVADSAEGEEPEEDTVGFLGGMFDDIFGWLRDIRDNIASVFTGITDGFSNLGSKITDTMAAIRELPSLIWTKISDGLKALFIPTQSQIESMRGSWEWTLSSRFGAVYQAGAMLFDVAGSVRDTAAQGVIEFPSVTVNLAGTDFTFGGYDVDVVPDGFEWLATTIKGVLDIVCTLAFINALKRRYDDILGGEE